MDTTRYDLKFDQLQNTPPWTYINRDLNSARSKPLPSHIIHTGDLAARLHIIRQLIGGWLLIISSRGLKVPDGGYTADQRTSPA